VDCDVEAISVTIRRWLEKYDRLLSPKYISGKRRIESKGCR
jgi:carboxypeptidase C (cathepsin A)